MARRLVLPSAAGSALQFSPGFKFSFDIDSVVTAGVGYCGSPGDKQHARFPALDLNVPPDREINSGAGFGLTPYADRAIVNLILGRRISWEAGLHGN